MLCCRYHICGHFVKPLTTRDRCSWVELVATGPQKPTWFISHWWGTPFSQTLEMLDWHGHIHDLNQNDAYWYCTLANVSGSVLCSWLIVVDICVCRTSTICVNWQEAFVKRRFGKPLLPIVVLERSKLWMASAHRQNEFGVFLRYISWLCVCSSWACCCAGNQVP